MKILFDQGIPVPLRIYLPGHIVTTSFERGWATLSNGELLDAAEAAGFELLMTTDQHLKDQQNLSERTTAVIVLCSTSWPQIQQRMDAIARIEPGGYMEVPI